MSTMSLRSILLLWVMLGFITALFSASSSETMARPLNVGGSSSDLVSSTCAADLSETITSGAEDLASSTVDHLGVNSSGCFSLLSEELSQAHSHASMGSLSLGASMLGATAFRVPQVLSSAAVQRVIQPAARAASGKALPLVAVAASFVAFTLHKISSSHSLDATVMLSAQDSFEAGPKPLTAGPASDQQGNTPAPRPLAPVVDWRDNEEQNSEFFAAQRDQYEKDSTAFQQDFSTLSDYTEALSQYTDHVLDSIEGTKGLWVEAFDEDPSALQQPDFDNPEVVQELLDSFRASTPIAESDSGSATKSLKDSDFRNQVIELLKIFSAHTPTARSKTHPRLELRPSELQQLTELIGTNVGDAGTEDDVEQGDVRQISYSAQDLAPQLMSLGQQLQKVGYDLQQNTHWQGSEFAVSLFRLGGELQLLGGEFAVAEERMTKAFRRKIETVIQNYDGSLQRQAEWLISRHEEIIQNSFWNVIGAAPVLPHSSQSAASQATLSLKDVGQLLKRWDDGQLDALVAEVRSLESRYGDIPLASHPDFIAYFSETKHLIELAVALSWPHVEKVQHLVGADVDYGVPYRDSAVYKKLWGVLKSARTQLTELKETTVQVMDHAFSEAMHQHYRGAWQSSSPALKKRLIQVLARDIKKGLHDGEQNAEQAVHAQAFALLQTALYLEHMRHSAASEHSQPASLRGVLPGVARIKEFLADGGMLPELREFFHKHNGIIFDAHLKNALPKKFLHDVEPLIEKDASVGSETPKQDDDFSLEGWWQEREVDEELMQEYKDQQRETASRAPLFATTFHAYQKEWNRLNKDSSSYFDQLLEGRVEIFSVLEGSESWSELHVSVRQFPYILKLVEQTKWLLQHKELWAATNAPAAQEEAAAVDDVEQSLAASSSDHPTVGQDVSPGPHDPTPLLSSDKSASEASVEADLKFQEKWEGRSIGRGSDEEPEQQSGEHLGNHLLNFPQEQASEKQQREEEQPVVSSTQDGEGEEVALPPAATAGPPSNNEEFIALRDSFVASLPAATAGSLPFRVGKDQRGLYVSFQPAVKERVKKTLPILTAEQGVGKHLRSWLKKIFRDPQSQSETSSSR